MAGELNWETDTQDYDGDEIPDVIRWQYEYLLETTEGQAWTARMQSDAPWVNDAFDDFNTLPEDIIELVIESTENYIILKMMMIHPRIHQTTTKLSLKNYTL